MKSLLETERLRLRPLEDSDAEWMAALHSDAEVMRFIPERPDDDDILAEVEALIHVYQYNRTFGFWAIEARDGSAIHGWVALKKLEATSDMEIGYRLKSSSWDQGIATEAAARLLRYAFEEAALPRVMAVARKENAASLRVMEKLGMHYLRMYRSSGEEWPNYVITREEWKALQSGPANG
jgi:RimJ/RimL family protein N-acetyltransferase